MRLERARDAVKAAKSQPTVVSSAERESVRAKLHDMRAGKGGNAQPLAGNEFTAQELGTKVHEDPRHERTAAFFGTHGALSIGRIV